MDDLLNRLFESSYADRALKIARLVLLWDSHFQQEPSCKEVSTRLFEIGQREERLMPLSLFKSSKAIPMKDPLISIPSPKQNDRSMSED